MKTGKIYILRLQSGKYYVGKTTNTERRWLEHKAGTGAKICQIDPPMEKVAEFDTKETEEKIVLYIEDLSTLCLMKHIGPRNVIGGRYITTDYRRVEDTWLYTEARRIICCLRYHNITIEPIINNIETALRLCK